MTSHKIMIATVPCLQVRAEFENSGSQPQTVILRCYLMSQIKPILIRLSVSAFSRLFNKNVRWGNDLSA